MTLLAIEFPDVKREDAEEAVGALRMPAAVTALTEPLTGRDEGGAAGLVRFTMPARSARVTRFEDGSGTM